MCLCLVQNPSIWEPFGGQIISFLSTRSSYVVKTGFGLAMNSKSSFLSLLKRGRRQARITMTCGTLLLSKGGLRLIAGARMQTGEGPG